MTELSQYAKDKIQRLQLGLDCTDTIAHLQLDDADDLVTVRGCTVILTNLLSTHIKKLLEEANNARTDRR